MNINLKVSEIYYIDGICNCNIHFQLQQNINILANWLVGTLVRAIFTVCFNVGWVCLSFISFSSLEMHTSAMDDWIC